MKPEIILIDRTVHTEPIDYSTPKQFDIKYVYVYKFSTVDALEKHDLVFGRTEELIDIMKQEFEQTLRELLTKS